MGSVTRCAFEGFGGCLRCDEAGRVWVLDVGLGTWDVYRERGVNIHAHYIGLEDIKIVRYHFTRFYHLPILLGYFVITSFIY